MKELIFATQRWIVCAKNQLTSRMDEKFEKKNELNVDFSSEQRFEISFFDWVKFEL